MPVSVDVEFWLTVIMASAESGLQLMARLSGRPSIINLDPHLFVDGLDMGDVVLVSGQPSTGKSMLLFKFIANCILPKTHGGMPISGLEANAILVETDHNNSILQLMAVLENILGSLPPTTGSSNSVYKNALTRDEKKSIIQSALKRLILLKTYSSDQLVLNFYAIEKLLTVNKKISLVAVDTISAFYWEDVVKLNGLRKKDLYLKNMMQRLQNAVKEYKIVTIIVRPASFQSKSHNPNICNCRYVIEMRKSGCEETGECLVKTGTSEKEVGFSVRKEGLKWLDVCGSAAKFEELVGKIKETQPEATVNGTIGRQGAFEIKINEKPVYSKLATLAYPDFDAVGEMVNRVEAGAEPSKIDKQQVITDCSLM